MSEIYGRNNSVWSEKYFFQSRGVFKLRNGEHLAHTKSSVADHVLNYEHCVAQILVD